MIKMILSLFRYKLGVLFFSLVLGNSLYSQINPDSNQNKVCIESIQINLLINKWFDFAPSYFVEQSESYFFFVSNHTELRDSTEYKSSIQFLKNGTYVQNTTFLDGSIREFAGVWSFDLISRTLRMKHNIAKCTTVYTVLELSRTSLILKVNHGETGLECP